jgi:hypothetical protein
VLFSANTTSSHIAKLADEYRCQIREQLIEPLSKQAVTICPDIWTDSYRQISYLGISVCFTDENYQFKTYDLCCYPFDETDKSAENVLIVSSKYSYVNDYSSFFRLSKRHLNPSILLIYHS